MDDPFQPGLLHRLPQTPRKVVVLRASRIGDFICAGPALRALRRTLPDAEIAVITLPLLYDLVVRSPDVDRFIAFPGFPGIAEQFFDAAKALRFFAAMQAERFDLAIQLQGSGVYSNPFIMMLGARWSAGFVRHGDPPGRLDAALPLPLYGHETRRVLALPTFLGATHYHDREIVFPLLPQDHEAAAVVLQNLPGPLIGVHAGAADSARRWPSALFAKVVNSLLQRIGGRVVIVGGAHERVSGEILRQTIGAAAVNLAGRLSLATFGAVVVRLTLLLTNDSGPAHVAYALRTPTVAVFVNGELSRYGPPSGPFRAVAPQGSEARQTAMVLQAANALLALGAADDEAGGTSDAANS